MSMDMTLRLRSWMLIVLLVVAFVGGLSFRFHRVVADTSLQCQQVSVPVTLAAGVPPQYTIAGWLCADGSWQSKTVQVLLHGLTYDHTYWDFPAQQPTYSYVQAATNAGYATFAIDRIGAGLSAHPAAASVTLESNAFVVHQLVQNLRDGAIGGAAFAKVILVGHSYGAETAVVEAATYADVDGVLLSGFLHVVNPVEVAAITATFFPATLDAKFRESDLPAGYFTTLAGTRGADFYHAADADPQIIAEDETLKQTVTAGELASLPDGLDPLLSQRIQVPVLAAIGQDDSIFCMVALPCDTEAEVLAREAVDYAPQACLEAYVLPLSGHDMNLHLNAQSWFAAAQDWANRRVGATQNQAPSQPC